MRGYRGHQSGVGGDEGGMRHDRARVRRAARAFVDRWAVEACDHCGRTLVLGEPATHVRRFDRDVVLCPTCLAAPEMPTFMAAPARHDRPAVPLAARERDLRRVA